MNLHPSPTNVVTLPLSPIHVENLTYFKMLSLFTSPFVMILIYLCFVKDELTNRIKPAYVFREEGPPYEETLLRQQSNPDQQPPPTLESDVLHQVEHVVGPATACLVVTYPGMGSVMCASAFLVADNPPTFATVRHAFAPVEINKHMRSYKDMFITTRVNASCKLPFKKCLFTP
jgi:hypothetical protein